MKSLLPLTGLVLLVACAAPVPNSAPERGPAFGSVDAYAAERARREAELSSMGRGSIDPEARAIAAETLTVLEARPDPMTGSINPGLGTPIDVATDRTTISDEQNFDAVAERETIASDAARIEQNAEAYTVVQPTAVPQRPNEGAPNVVAYALSTSNRLGERIYERSSLFSESRYDRACSGFSSQDEAQAEFLRRGGPERDRAGMDPDGDGFACQWNPMPYRMARGG